MLFEVREEPTRQKTSGLRASFNFRVRFLRVLSESKGQSHGQTMPNDIYSRELPSQGCNASGIKTHLFKYVHDNILQQIDKNVMNPHREVESLYLLIALSEIGKEYWLPENTLAKHFLLIEDPSSGKYDRELLMNYFSITVLLSYIKEKKRYAKLKSFIEEHVVKKLSYMKAHCNHDAECVMLFLDLLVCPFISNATKLSLAKVYGLDANGMASIKITNDFWFTNWGQKFDLKKELDAKRSREVY